MNGVAGGDFSIRVPAANRRDEVGTLAAAFNEMTARLERSRQLETQLHEAEKAAVVGRLASAIAHEIRNPLNYINLTLDHLRSNFAPVEPQQRETFEKLKADKILAKRQMAEAMLRAYDDGRPVRSVVYPVQAIRFGKNVAILALGGEVVIDYDLRAKREYPKQKLVVAGYSNDVMCYIPSKRVLEEGGYEAVDSMPYYGQPGPFTPEVEETIFDAIHRVLKRVGI